MKRFALTSVAGAIILVIFAIVAGVDTLSAITYKDIPKVQGASFRYDEMENDLTIRIPFPFPLGSLNIDMNSELITIVTFEDGEIERYGTFLHFFTMKDWITLSLEHNLSFLVDDTLRFSKEAHGHFEVATFILSTKEVETIAAASAVKFSITGMGLLIDKRKFKSGHFETFRKMVKQLEILDSLTALQK